MQTEEISTTTNAQGVRINVKYVVLGSIFRQFVITRLNVNYFHYIWRLCGVALSLFVALLLVQIYPNNIPRIGMFLLTMTCVVAAALYCVMTEIVEEAVDVVDGFGLQLSARARFGQENKTFLEFGDIKDIVINEAISMQRVLFYLALLIHPKRQSEESSNDNVQTKTELMALFQSTMPRLNELRKIYNEIEPFVCNHNKKQ